MMNTCLTFQSCNRTCTNLFFKRVLERKLPRKRIIRLRIRHQQGWRYSLCSCGKYKPMTSHAENIGCLDKYKICERFFKGIQLFFFEFLLSCNLLVRRKRNLNCARFLLTLNNFQQNCIPFGKCYFETFPALQTAVLTFRNCNKQN